MDYRYMMIFRNEWEITLHMKVREDKQPHSVKGKEPEFKQMCPSLQLFPYHLPSTRVHAQHRQYHNPCPTQVKGQLEAGWANLGLEAQTCSILQIFPWILDEVLHPISILYSPNSECNSY